MTVDSLYYSPIIADKLPSLTQDGSFDKDSNNSSVISWRYSSSMSLSSHSSERSLKYVNIQMNVGETRRKTKRKKNLSKSSKNFVLFNQKNITPNNKTKLGKIDLPNDNKESEQSNIKIPNNGRETVIFPKLNYSGYNYNNNHNIGISSVRSTWPDVKITQSEHQLKGEIDRLQRSRDDLTRRNNYLEREIVKEQELLKNSFPGRTLEHLKIRGGVLMQEKEDAQKTDREAHVKAVSAENDQFKAQADYNSILEKLNSLQEKRNDAREKNANEKFTEKEQEFALTNLQTELSTTEREYEEVNKQLLEVKETNEKDNKLLEESKMKLNNALDQGAKFQNQIQIVDSKNLDLCDKIKQLEVIKENLIRRRKLSHVDLEKVSESLEVSRSEEEKLIKDVKEISEMVKDHQQKFNEMEDVKQFSKTISCQTFEKLTYTRNIAWVRVAEEETIYSAEYTGEKDGISSKITPVLEVFDSKTCKNENVSRYCHLAEKFKVEEDM